MADQYRTGTIIQSGLKHHPEDYAHFNVTHSVLGIVMGLNWSDGLRCVSAQKRHDGRGNYCEATVRVLNDGTDSPWYLHHVVIPPRGSSGADNFYEELPKPCSGTVDESQWVTEYGNATPIDKLDGDYCVVDFIGGNLNSPFMSCWWPHKTNTTDPATSNDRSNGALVQGRRLVRRFQGTRLAITSKGTVMLDTSEANHLLQGKSRTAKDDGGDVKVTVKNNRALDINFNQSVFDPAEPDFLWGPKPVEKERSTESTHVTLTKDQIQAIAGEVVNLLAKRGDIVLSTPEGKIQLGSGATEPFVLGNSWVTMMNQLIDAILQSNVPTAFGLSGPISGGAGAVPLANVKAALSTHLSEFIFGKKNAG